MPASISTVYEGVPAHLYQQVKWVATEYRTHPLSHEPGGCNIIVEYHNGKVLGYNRVKFPSYYIGKFWHGNLIVVDRDFSDYSRSFQNAFIKKHVSRIFAADTSDDRNELSRVSFKEVWNAIHSTDLPWKVLKPFNAPSNTYSKPKRSVYS